ncbi:MAG: Rho termination factor N-terminal domain-containing protein, partial [Acidimicrobiales bacterium]
ARAKESGVATEEEAKQEPARPSKAANVQQQFGGMTKAELLERAAELELEGRSRMTKPELVDALTDLAATKRRRRRAS